jgi:hypothetical protein
MYKGEKLESKELASVFGITTEALRKRLKQGWVYKHDMLVCPKRKQREVKEPVLSPHVYDLQGSFVGESTNEVI